MSLFSFFRRRPKPSKRKAAKPSTSKARLVVESLEDRLIPSATAISGYVFADANNNGIYDPGETPIANAPVQLRDTNNNILGNTTSDANGYYQFAQDNTINQAPVTVTENLTFPTTQTDYTLPGSVDQFDPSLGQLQSIQITHAGSVTSDIQVENTSTVSASTINGTVSGSLELTGSGVDSKLNLTQNAGSFNATIFDGALDYGGTSGTDLGAQTANGTQTVTLTGSDMTPYIGTGQVQFTENAHATSYASGGGNLSVLINSTGTSTVTVTYTYIPSNNLKPGNYQVIQTTQPPGYIDGQISSNGVVIPHQPNVDVIPVTLDGTDNAPNNDFGKLQPAGVSGYVYFDANDNGIMDPSETGISGVVVSLTGTGTTGPVTLTTSTDSTGYYQFPGLTPGTYSVTETAPANYLDGQVNPGSLGGTVSGRGITDITLPSAGTSVSNNFGEIKESSLSGYVYVDAKDDGVMDAGDPPIAGDTITLSGTGADGSAVNLTATTDSTGYYSFTGLESGSYTITQSPPANYFNGHTNVGSQGGTAGANVISNVSLPANTVGINNDFGEVLPASLSGYVYVDANNNGVKDAADSPVAGDTITLTGTGAAGSAVNLTATTDSTGYYSFTGLESGSYTIAQTPPANYFNGQTNVGSQGGTAGANVISNVNLPPNVTGINNNFGEVLPASLSGYVYIDANSNGIKDPGESGFQGATVTLTGFNDQGPVTQTATTDANGFYQFQTLRPGTYALTQSNTSTYLNGTDSIGSQGGTVSQNDLSNIALASGITGVNNDFALVSPANADLSIVKTASASSVLVGSTINYTLTVTNNGSSTAQNVQVVDNLPADASYVSSSGAGWTITEVGNTLTATMPSLAVGGAAPIYVTVKAPAVTDTLVNTATVSSSTPDNNPTNNSSTVTVTVYNQPGTTFPTGIIPLGGAFGALPIVSKVQLFSVDPTPYISPGTLSEMTYVTGAYDTVLGRSPTTSELMAAVNQMQAGATPTTIANTLWNSTEHRTQQADALYKTFLGRNPSGAELSSAIQALQSGTSEMSLSLSLVNSAEYQASHPTPGTVVAGLYASILNETPDASTQLQAANALANQTVSAFAQSLMLSTAGLTTIINDAYLAVLRRAATSTEIQNWITQLQGSQVSFDQMQIDLLTSSEFAQLAANSISAR